MGTDYPGLGTRRYVERRIAPGEEYLIAGHTERQQNEILLEGDPSSPIAPRETVRAFARLWRAVFPTVVALAFSSCRSRRHRPMTDCGTNLTIHPLQ